MHSLTFHQNSNKNIWLPIISSLVMHVVFTLILQYFFDIQFEKNRWILADFLVGLSISYLIFGISRSNIGFLLIQFFLYGFLFVGHAIKIGAFGAPITPDDLFAFAALFNILLGWQFWLLLISFSFGAVALLYNIKISNLGNLLVAVTFGMLIYGLATYPSMIAKNLDKMGYVVWSQRINYVAHGPFLYSIHEIARFLNAQKVPPSNQEVVDAYNALMIVTKPTMNDESIQMPLGAVSPKRNVHIILLESFWDPTLLQGVKFSQDPFVSKFRALWKKSGNSKILSPVYGGYTANAEFELLCGFPVEEDSVKFERGINNNVPCLPKILNKAGYITYASHPNTASFWNRLNAYKRIGFDRSLFINSFEKQDLAQNEFMGDSTYYAQTFGLLAKAKKVQSFDDSKKPIFNYMVTIFGHLPYPLTESRPKVVTAIGASATVEAYANNVYYKTKEFIEVLEQLQRNDPNALIIAFGDHLPNLGQNFAGYSDSGFLKSNKSEFTGGMLQNMTSTPILIIDGDKGVQNVGNIALFSLPKMILQYLNLPDDPLLNLSNTMGNTIIRPLAGQALEILKNNESRICRTEESCPNTEQWLKNIRVIMIDLFQGKQYVLKLTKNL